jgi:hypothetical protein
MAKLSSVSPHQTASLLFGWRAALLLLCCLTIMTTTKHTALAFSPVTMVPSLSSNSHTMTSSLYSSPPPRQPRRMLKKVRTYVLHYAATTALLNSKLTQRRSAKNSSVVSLLFLFLHYRDAAIPKTDEIKTVALRLRPSNSRGTLPKVDPSSNPSPPKPERITGLTKPNWPNLKSSSRPLRIARVWKDKSRKKNCGPKSRRRTNRIGLGTFPWELPYCPSLSSNFQNCWINRPLPFQTCNSIMMVMQACKLLECRTAQQHATCNAQPIVGRHHYTYIHDTEG